MFEHLAVVRKRLGDFKTGCAAKAGRVDSPLGENLIAGASGLMSPVISWEMDRSSSAVHDDILPRHKADRLLHERAKGPPEANLTLGLHCEFDTDIVPRGDRVRLRPSGLSRIFLCALGTPSRPARECGSNWRNSSAFPKGRRERRENRIPSRSRR